MMRWRWGPCGAAALAGAVSATCPVSSGFFRAQRPVLVHAHSGRLPSLAARLARVPIIIDTRHGIPERLRPLYARFPSLRLWEGAKSRLAHRTLCVCEADAAWMECVAMLPRRFLRVVRNGITVPPGAGTPERRSAARVALGFTPDEPVLAFVGRLAAAEGANAGAGAASGS